MIHDLSIRIEQIQFKLLSSFTVYNFEKTQVASSSNGFTVTSLTGTKVIIFEICTVK